MSLPPSPGDPHPYPYPPPRQGLSLGAGAALGVVTGLVGPVVLAALAWVVGQSGPGEFANLVIGLSLVVIIFLPVVLLVLGCLLMIHEATRGWGVASLMAAGVWLICSAGVCTLFFFGAAAVYGSAAVVIP